MLRELIHLARHAPEVLLLKRKLEQVDLYDTVMQRADDAGFRARRTWLASGARGDVLEIGCGTGFMFEHYLTDARVTAIDVEQTFLERAREKAKRKRVEVMTADAQALPFADASFDVAIACLVFCSIPDAARALDEAKRVLRPGGELRLVEHVISERPIPSALMRAADPLWLYLNEQGCHMHRDTLAAVQHVFGNCEIEERFQLWSAGLPAFPMVALRAKKI